MTHIAQMYTCITYDVGNLFSIAMCKYISHIINYVYKYAHNFVRGQGGHTGLALVAGVAGRADALSKEAEAAILATVARGCEGTDVMNGNSSEDPKNAQKVRKCAKNALSAVKMDPPPPDAIQGGV